MLLPSIALAAGLIAVYMRLLRSDMIATLQENYITMARAKGLSDRRILWRHALRPSSLTLLTVAGLNFGTLIGGAVAVEVIFSIPGMGTLIYQAINARQIVELQSYIAIIAIGYVLINFTIDALYIVLDPRIRRARARLSSRRRTRCRELVGDAADRGIAGRRRHHRDRRGRDPARRRAAPEARASGFGAWLSIGWLAFVVGRGDPGAVCCRSTTRRRSSPRSRAAGPFADAGTAPGHLLGGDFNGRDMLVAPASGAAARTLVVATVAVLHRLRARRARSGCSAATSAARSTPSSACCSTSSSPSPR